MLPPIVWPPDWTAEDYRVIAGFLLYFRAAILQAKASVNDPAFDVPVLKPENIRDYYDDAESVTRWLLSYTPYPVAKGQLWNPNSQYYPRQSGIPRSTG